MFRWGWTNARLLSIVCWMDLLSFQLLKKLISGVEPMALFQAAVPISWFEDNRKAAGQAPEKGVYTSAVTSYLMVWQWLNADHTLEPAVEEVISGRVNDLLRSHKRLAEETLSARPAAYNKARHRLSREVIEAMTDEVARHLLAQVPDVLPGLGRRVFLLDGSTLNLTHTEKILDVYPPPSNQYGPCHWPQMRIVVAHELLSGMALRPVGARSPPASRNWPPMLSIAFPLTRWRCWTAISASSITSIRHMAATTMSWFG